MGNSASTKQPARERGSSAAELAENSERGSSGSERPSFSEKTSSMKRLGSKKGGVVDHTPGVECVKHYQFGRCFGRGAFGKVHSVQRKVCGTWFAAKALDLKVALQSDPKMTQVVSEVNILTKLSAIHHPFMVNLHYGMVENHSLYLVLDLCNAGSLEAYLESKPDLLITESIAQFYIANVLLGLKHIHDQRIIQRDIKPDNLLLADNGYLKLTDFGISASTSKQSTTTSMKSGTLRYMAPEMFCKIPRHNYLVDIYATGIVMFELLYRKVPYERGLKQAGPFVDKAKKEDPQPTEIPKGYDIKFIDLPATTSQPSDDCKNAVEQMTHVWPWRRIGVAGGMDGGVKEVLDHAFFKNIDCNAILAQTLPAPIVPDADGRAVAQQTEDVMDLFGEEEKDQTILTEKQLTIIKNLEEKLSAINLIERQKGEVQESSSAGS